MKICFWGNVSGALNGHTVGGAELQIALLAKSLASIGHEVVIINFLAKKSYTTPEGIKVLHVPDWNKGFRVLRLFLHRIPSLWKLFVEQNADIYYVRTRSFFHLLPYLAARKTKAKFIMAMAHDLDLMSLSDKIKIDYRHKSTIFRFLTFYLVNDIVFNYLLKRADFVLVQHSGQKPKRNAVRGKLVVFPNIIDKQKIDKQQNPVEKYFVHVGTLTVLKGSENLLNLVKIVNSDIQIMIVGEPFDEKSKIIVEKLKEYPNIKVMGRVDHTRTIELISNSKALISTSNYEGFPNIFLEAWATGVPVISLHVNPGDVLNRFPIGVFCNNDLDRMKICMENDNDLTRFERESLLSYVYEFHSCDGAADRFLSSINNNNRN
jgi:glycosyltransferase involved in cell wall biosynthesis